MELRAGLQDLPKVAEKIVELSAEYSIMAFFGDLGAGKTTLIKNICNFLHVNDEVNSPTFSLVNEYQDRNGKTLYHFDFYRIKEEEEALDMGCEEYFYSGNLCLIEWPEMVKNLLPEKRLEIHISLSENDRVFNLKSCN